MKILAIEAAANVASAAVVCDNVLLAEEYVNNKKTHSQMLMPMISNVLEASGEKIENMDVIACSAGPGSFTGVRIGLATAKGLAAAANKPVAAVSTLCAMAYNLFGCAYTIVPIMDARRAQVYCAAYRWENENLNTVMPPCAMSVCDLLSKLSGECIFIGDGVLVYREEILRVMGDRAKFAGANASLQRASSVAALAKKKAEAGELETYESASAVYLRKSQAEREYEEKNK